MTTARPGGDGTEREPTTRPRIPLICPRCGHEQQVVPGGPERAVKVVHVGTGREACEPGDLARAPDDDGP
ncbi:MULTISPECIES: hypothetical protein [Streptomyces]|uniref:hypothetical protein n=1 Tax=Streptomyces TaxID=1883 RepID=UPI0004ABBFF8|nr:MULTISPECIES: hypothetical protein [Streptomyces]